MAVFKPTFSIDYDKLKSLIVPPSEASKKRVQDWLKRKNKEVARTVSGGSNKKP